MKKKLFDYQAPGIFKVYVDVPYGVIAASHEGLDDGDDLFDDGSHEGISDGDDLFG